MTYRSFMVENYPPEGGTRPGTTSFRTVRSVARGFGGVAFGAQVRASSDLPKPLSMSWVNSASPPGSETGEHYGFFTISFANGMKGHTSVLPATLAYAARAIVFGQNENGESIQGTTG